MERSFWQAMLSRTWRGLSCAVIVLASGVAAAQEGKSALSYGVLLQSRYDSNIGLAPDNASDRDVITTRVAAEVTWKPLETAKNALTLTAGPYYDGVEGLTDLTNYGVIVKGRLLHQFTPSFTSVWVALSGEGMWMEFDDSELRSGYRGDFELAVGKQFNQMFGLSLGYRYQVRESTESLPEGSVANRNSDDIFDQSRDGPFIKLDINPAPRLAVFVEYSMLSGDVAATGAVSGFNEPAAFDVARDFAFEEGVRFLVWRIDADQDLYTIGGTYSFLEKWSANVSASSLKATGEFNNDYDNVFFTVGVSRSF